MDYSDFVSRGERLDHLLDYGQGLVDCHASDATEMLGKRFTRQQLHGQKVDRGDGSVGFTRST